MLSTSARRRVLAVFGAAAAALLLVSNGALDKARAVGTAYPTVRITSPQNLDEVTGTVTVTVTVTEVDGDGRDFWPVGAMALYANGVQVAQSTQPTPAPSSAAPQLFTYSLAWNTAALSPNEYTLQAKVTTGTGPSSTSGVLIASPVNSTSVIVESPWNATDPTLAAIDADNEVDQGIPDSEGDGLQLPDCSATVTVNCTLPDPGTTLVPQSSSALPTFSRANTGRAGRLINRFRWYFKTTSRIAFYIQQVDPPTEIFIGTADVRTTSELSLSRSSGLVTGSATLTVLRVDPSVLSQGSLSGWIDINCQTVHQSIASGCLTGFGTGVNLAAPPVGVVITKTFSDTVTIASNPSIQYRYLPSFNIRWNAPRAIPPSVDLFKNVVTGKGLVSATIRCEDGRGLMGPGCEFPRFVPLIRFGATVPTIRDHIAFAQTTKSLPRTLHRLQNTTVRDANRRRVCATLPASAFNSTLNSCDEYPFAASYEGGNLLAFSVRAVPGVENSRQGGLLVQFYNRFRILDVLPFAIGDAFTVGT